MSGLTNDAGPVFHLEPEGMLANRMIEYMVALKFVSLVPGCRVSNIDLPEWNIHHPRIDSPGPTAVERAQQHIDLAGLSTRMRAGTIRRVDWAGYGQRMEQFLPRQSYFDVFVPPFKTHVGFGSEYLVCHVRAGEILNGTAPEYPLTPVEFFADVINLTGLKPVFMGQTAPNAYTLRLREHFPAALFLEPRDIVLDFETIRQSKNIVVGVSTYAWLASWLSHADNIFMAVSGQMNPMQVRQIDLLPLGDPRYRFALFPINYGVPLHQHATAHQRIAPYWRFVTHEVLRRQLAAMPRFERKLETMLAAFDEEFYLSDNGDVLKAVQDRYIASGRAHYIAAGFNERRHPFALDRRWYAAQYPLAALEVAQADYTDFSHHYQAIGKARGYRPVPE